MAVLSKHVCKHDDRTWNQQTAVPQPVKAVLNTDLPAYETTAIGAGYSCASCEDPEEAKCSKALGTPKSPGLAKDICAITSIPSVVREKESTPVPWLESNSSLSTPPTSQSESAIFRLNRKRTLHLGQKLIRRYKRLLRSSSNLEEGKLQLRSKAFRFIRRSRRGRTEELKALIAYFYKIMRQEVKPRGWIRRLLEEMLKLASKFGMSWTESVDYNGFRLRAMASKLVGDIEKIEESPGTTTEEEADKGFFNKSMGTWGCWSESEWEMVRDGRHSGKTAK